MRKEDRAPRSRKAVTPSEPVPPPRPGAEDDDVTARRRLNLPAGERIEGVDPPAPKARRQRA